jgi:hypothetical protein
MPLRRKCPQSQISNRTAPSGSDPPALAIDILEKPQTLKVWQFPHYGPNLKSKIKLWLLGVA